MMIIGRAESFLLGYITVGKEDKYNLLSTVIIQENE